MNEPTKPELFCQVAVALPVPGSFTYAVPEPFRQAIRPGYRVLVPFGRRRVTGYVLELADRCEVDPVKPIHDLLDDRPAFDNVRASLFRFVSDYYLQPLGEVIKTGLPAGINRESKAAWSLTDAGEAAQTAAGVPASDRRVLLSMEPGASYAVKQLARRCSAATPAVLTRLSGRGWVEKNERLDPASARARFTTVYAVAQGVDSQTALADLASAPRQVEAFKFLLSVGSADTAALLLAMPRVTPALNALVRKALVVATRQECYRDVECGFVEAKRGRIRLNTHQRNAFEAIGESIRQGGYAPFLIHGVTGSGKTEVYLRLAGEAVKRRRAVLVLVPEIALTPQLVSRFFNRFGSRVAVSHSGLSDPQRFDQWRRMLRGEADVCVGTRSAVFSPLANLGLVVVDEEHDTSYKQDEGVPYNARDLALMLGKLAEAPVVLGSATPSLESYHHAQSGRYRLLDLPQRATAGALPAVQVIDLVDHLAKSKHRSRAKSSVDEAQARNPSTVSARYALTDPLNEAIAQALKAGEQAILFLNRRGFSSHAFCLGCRRSVMCPNCSVTLTAHQGGAQLRCHYCDHSQPANLVCDHCGGTNFFLAGLGTQQVEAALAERFAEARIARLDRDTTTRQGALAKILSDFGQHRYDLLVGTQIVTKGHDFPGVTLVGVLSADVGLNLPDFRSTERTFQLLAQVAGRAGRGDRPGRVIVQTFNPDHYAIVMAKKHDFAGFHEIECQKRADAHYPPFIRLALVRARAQKAESARAFLVMIANSLRQYLRENRITDAMVLGPAPSMVPRIKNLYRFQVLIKAPSPAQLVSLAARAARLAGEWQKQRVDWRLDIDPQNLL